MAWLYQQKRLTPESLNADAVLRFIDEHAALLNRGVDYALRDAALDDISVRRLKESCYVFSGVKTFIELREAFPAVTDAQGNIRPFNDFLADVTRINRDYNHLYLRTEYHFAVSCALMAARWKSFERDADDYNLQYRTVGDDRVRPTHRLLEGITLPFSSPFWDKYFPPNNWNCRCSVVQVRRSKYPESDLAEAMKRGAQATESKYSAMFQFNPGKQMTCFPAYNAYTRRACASCDGKGDSRNELCRVCAVARSLKSRV